MKRTKIESNRQLDEAVQVNAKVQVEMTHGIKGREVFTGELVDYSQQKRAGKKFEFVQVFGRYSETDRKILISLQLAYVHSTALLEFERNIFII